MTEIVRAASAGTLESSDAYVEIEPAGQGIEIQLESVVKGQFGESILAAVRETLAGCGVERARVPVADRIAVEGVLRARLDAALLPGRGEC